MKFKLGALFIPCLYALAACAGRIGGSHADSAGAGNAATAGNSGIAGAVSGSGGSTSGGAGNGGTGGGSSSGGADTCSIAGPSAQELSATPRSNTNLELLALKFSSGIVAEQAIYDRLVRDVAAIVARDPSVSDIRYFAPHDGKGLLLVTDEQTLGQMRAGTYSDWNCLNQTYGVENTEFNAGSVSFAVLTLEGIYDIPRLAKQYAALPKIRSAEANIGGGDGPTICVTRESDVWHYVFDRASGDCPAGCTEHEYFHFTVTTSGSVEALGALSTAEAATYASREACR
ncbi:MAG TPA: hypothetical protein VFK05_13290 [Polyangiaceae bacterium]|nr:hypothetical protein [Polyangiaceae bacterium]